MPDEEIKAVVSVTLECDCVGGSPVECLIALQRLLPKEVQVERVHLENFRIAEAHYIKA
jgi:hypothetical protein